MRLEIENGHALCSSVQFLCRLFTVMMMFWWCDV